LLAAPEDEYGNRFIPSRVVYRFFAYRPFSRIVSENFMRFPLSFLLSVSLTELLCCAAAGSLAQAPHQAPKIDKIDPPGWWAGLPNPMLLVHGEGLNGARFTLGGKDVTLERTQASENGHWAFLWLDTNAAAPQTLWVTAANGDGQARSAYVLAARGIGAHAHAGFSSADVLYLIMTDRFAQASSAVDPPGDDRAEPRAWHGGDLAGIEQHLDYLKQLGVTRPSLPTAPCPSPITATRPPISTRSTRTSALSTITSISPMPCTRAA
jgi:hypothetical protein